MSKPVIQLGIPTAILSISQSVSQLGSKYVLKADQVPRSALFHICWLGWALSHSVQCPYIIPDLGSNSVPRRPQVAAPVVVPAR